MTPPALDVASIHAKLRMLREILDDLDALDEVTAKRLGDDRMLRYAVERMLTQLVDVAVAINGHIASARLGEGAADYRGTFALMARAGALPAELAADLAPSVGLRNLLTHEYAAIDLGLVAASVRVARNGYRRYVAAVATFLGEPAG